MSTTTNKKTQAQLTKLMGELQEQFGTESVMMASQIPTRPLISSGSLAEIAAASDDWSSRSA